MYAPVLGYRPVSLAATGIENSENDFLSGESDKLFADRVKDMFTGNNTGGGNVRAVAEHQGPGGRVEAADAQRARASTKGAAVAIDPRTGAIQAMVVDAQLRPEPAGQPRREGGRGGVQQAEQGQGPAAAQPGHSARRCRPARRSR